MFDERAKKLFQNGDWPVCLGGPVPVLKQLLNGKQGFRVSHLQEMVADRSP